MAKKLGSASDEVTNLEAQEPLRTLMPLLVQQLKRYRERVLAAPYYWRHHNLTYLSQGEFPGSVRDAR
jgi:hypothetical protein